MKKILLVSGSTRKEGSTRKMLNQLPLKFPHFHWTKCESHEYLPLFKPESSNTKEVDQWALDLSTHDIIFFCIPEYIHNMPAIIKNALEWVTASGELVNKKVISATYTPNHPRGEKAMQSMLWSLKALDANILPSLSLYHNQFNWVNNEIMDCEGIEMIEVLIKM